MILHRIFDVKFKGGRLPDNVSTVLSTCTHSVTTVTMVIIKIPIYRYYFCIVNVTVNGGKPRTNQNDGARQDLKEIVMSWEETQEHCADRENHRSRIRILRIFSFLKFNEFFWWKKNQQKIRNFANHRCLICFDVLECNVHL